MTTDQPGRPALQVRDLSVTTRSGTHLLSDLTFAIADGERVGLIGESGSGKSLTALAVMGLLSESLTATGGIRVSGHERNLIGEREGALSRLRGTTMAMVFQEPMTALNPTMRVGQQVAEVLTIHRRARGAQARERAVALLDQVGLPEPAETAHAFPHQLSGGQRQRVVIAMALANDPALLVCDEPTTALDVTVQDKVLGLIVDGVEARDAALLFITHDLAVVSRVCERVLVMYGGRIVESGPVGQVFAAPRHHYTAGLVAASALTGPRGGLSAIPGTVPSAGRFPTGCVFRTRCAAATSECEIQPRWDAAGAQGWACHHPIGAS
ncbi:ABC transporter ATP-binding protein [Kribbia dieselivorans]|uniref:ABC transporter ATP-binding protein n=1 Tax=Kribbia dieselivorans TaxID=331526 RepID=UPI000838959B